MLLILLKSSACLAIFMLFYKWCLEKTSAHTFKRFYLLAVILISISIPFITFTDYVDAETTAVSAVSQFNSSESVNISEITLIQEYLPMLLWHIYVLGVLLFSVRFFKNLNALIQKIKANPKLKNENFINVLLQDLIHPHTFFNYIFLNKTKYESNQIQPEVLLHEQTHAKQKHALDILFIELIQILFWFNPLLHFIKKDIKLNHEFLADQAVIDHGFNTQNYQHLLLTFSSNASHSSLANAINYSLIKKRFTVMKTQTSKTTLRLRSLIMLPLLAILIYSFSTKETKYVAPNIFIESEAPQELRPQEGLNNNPDHIKNKLQNTSSIKIKHAKSQQRATPKQISEYNTLAKKYNAQSEDRRIIKLKDLNRLEYLYRLMSKDQKAKAEPFPNCPPPPPAPKAPEASKVRPPKAPEPPKPPKTGFIEIEGKDYFYSTNNGETKYYTRQGIEVDKKGNKLSTKQSDGSKVVDNQRITKVFKNNKVVSEFKKNWDDEKINDIPTPPEPKSPLDYVIDMSKKGATFYYNGKKVSSDKAIALMKADKDLNISSKTNNGTRVVKIQTEPISF
ncbi:M56 family metallopeptidase [Changchengzhania lutea]|uniref:M56 family metallopeptidase n=1 Tax=Changchengzhania lutea TaxID=2049305 RepID=UPI00115D7024|nr:M56 family metallopeptidase [Changchengzhania lutea]